MKRLLFLVNIALIVALLLAYASPYIAPETWYIPQLFGLFYKYILGANIFFVVFWLFFRKRYLKYSFIAILIGFGFVSREYKWSGNTQENDKNALSILTYNVRKFNSNPTELFEFVAAENTNLLCFQEYSNKKYKKYGKPLIHKRFPHSYIVGEVAIFSQFPLVNKKKIAFEKGHYVSAIQADIITPKDTLCIINIHLESNKLSSGNKQDVENFVSNKERDVNKLKSIGRKLKKASLNRKKQIEIVAKIIEESPFPVILCGDFNDVPMSYSYQRIKNLLADSFVEAGKGSGKTFRERSIEVRIDYIFSNLKIRSHKVSEVNFSDHKPVTATLSYLE